MKRADKVAFVERELTDYYVARNDNDFVLGPLSYTTAKLFIATFGGVELKGEKVKYEVIDEQERVRRKLRLIGDPTVSRHWR